MKWNTRTITVPRRIEKRATPNAVMQELRLRRPPAAGTGGSLDYIARWYNPLRRHASLGNASPITFERAAVAYLPVH